MEKEGGGRYRRIKVKGLYNLVLATDYARSPANTLKRSLMARSYVYNA